MKNVNAPINYNKIISIIKSWKKLKLTQKPIIPKFDNFPNWNQTETEYQAEQKKWLNKINIKKVK